MADQPVVASIPSSPPRPDAIDKAQGKHRYAADYYGDDLLWAGVKRAPIAHGVLRKVETRAARALPGVIAVLTHQDVAGTNRQGVARKDQPVLVDDKVRHLGDGVALVVAQDKAALAAALDRVEISCDPLPGIFDMDQALVSDAPLIHEDHASNLLLGGEIERGDAQAVMDRCAVQVEARFDLPRQEHAYLETEAGWARLEADGRLCIVASTQTPHRDQSEVAQALGLDIERVRIIAPMPGGGFGGKDGITVQSLLGLAALACPGRAIKMWLSREESFLAGVKRHPARVHYRMGADSNGRFQALMVRADYDTGPYDHLGGVVMTLGLEHCGGAYCIDQVSLRSRAIYTNNPVSGAFRGFGIPQVTAGLEQTIDRLADKLAMDPIKLRLLNLVQPHGRNPAGAILSDPQGLAKCLGVLRGHQAWAKREEWKAGADQFKRRGVGVSALLHGMGYGPVIPDQATAQIELTSNGGLLVDCGVVDMGQGNGATYLQIAGQVLAQPMEAMDLVQTDTDRTMPCGSASASRTTFTFGNALVGAAEALRRNILTQAASMLDHAFPEDLELRPGLVCYRAEARELDLAVVAGAMKPDQRRTSHTWQAPVADDRPVDDEMLQMHGLPHRVFSYGAHLAMVEADELTGQVEVKDFVAVNECGGIINPQAVEQQVQGGVAQGLGYALYEDMAAFDGSIQTPNLATYIIPTAPDLPDMESVTVDGHCADGPFGLKGVGELGTDGPLPAVANAVADACGITLRRFPVNPEQVLAALVHKRAMGDKQ